MVFVISLMRISASGKVGGGRKASAEGSSDEPDRQTFPYAKEQ
jgi:hypothetical protein